MIKNITMKNCASYDSTGVNNIEDCESHAMLQAKKDEKKLYLLNMKKCMETEFSKERFAFQRSVCRRQK